MEIFGKFYVDELEGKSIALFHGDPNETADKIFESKKYDIVLRGHSHIAEIKKNKNTLMINPGGLIESFPEVAKEKWTKPSVALYDLEKNNAKIIRI